MGRKPTADSRRLRYKLTTHVNVHKKDELTAILGRNPTLDMSTLVRHILENRRVKVYVHDETLDNWMDELSKLRTEIRAIGININQITKGFNTYPEPDRKAAYAKMAFAEYLLLQPKIELIGDIMKKLANKWLSE